MKIEKGHRIYIHNTNCSLVKSSGTSQHTLRLRVTHDCNRIDLRTRIRIEPKLWDKKRQKVKQGYNLNGNSYKMKLPRSGVRHDEIVTLKGVPSNTQAQIHYRRYPSANDYTTEDFQWKNGEWQATLPVQPVAGKLQYYITVGGKDYLAEEPLLIRFRNDVPAGILVPHILLMFAAMLFAVYTFLLVISGKAYGRWLKITVATLFVGGFIRQPMFQEHATKTMRLAVRRVWGRIGHLVEKHTHQDLPFCRTRTGVHGSPHASLV